MNKTRTFLTGLFLAAASCANASSHQNQPGMINDYSCCPSYCDDSSCHNWEFNAEFLWLRATEDGLAVGEEMQYRLQEVNDEIEFDNSHYKLDVKNPKWKWDAGVRLGCTYKPPCQEWIVGAYWTQFDTKTHHQLNIKENRYWNDTMTGSFFNVFPGGRVKSDWKLDLDSLDVILARDLQVANCLRVRPFAGLRAAWIKQKFHVSYHNNNVIEVEDVTSDYSRTHLKSDFSGIGLLGGLDLEWNLRCGFSIYGSAAGALLYGRFDNHSKNHSSHEYVDSQDSDDVTAVNKYALRQNHRFSTCQVISDAAVGLRWKKECICKHIDLTLQVGWENHIYFDQNRLETFAVYWNPSSNGNLCIQGFTFGGRLDF